MSRSARLTSNPCDKASIGARASLISPELVLVDPALAGIEPAPSPAQAERPHRRGHSPAGRVPAPRTILLYLLLLSLFANGLLTAIVLVAQQGSRSGATPPSTPAGPPDNLAGATPPAGWAAVPLIPPIDPGRASAQR